MTSRREAMRAERRAKDELTLPLHVEEHGTGTRPLVLVHGFGGNSYTWRHWLPRLRDRFRVYVVDLKGHGAADKPADGAYSPLDHAELLCRMIEGRGLEDATLVGHSLGGGIALITALHLAERAPGALRSLVLISGATRPQEIPRYIGLARRPLLGPALLEIVPPSTLIRWALRSIVHRPEAVTAGQISAYSEPLGSREGRRALLEGARRILPPEAKRWIERYPELDLPTLLLWGAEDPVVPVALGRELAGILPKARLEIVDCCGHIPQEERPDEAFEPFLRFLDEF